MSYALRRHLSIALLWVCAPLYALVVRVGLTAISPHDYWWPIVQGRAALQLGHIPDSNLFVHTIPPDVSFFNQPWLAQRAMWWLFEAGGPAAGVYANAGLLCASFLCLMWGARRLGASLRVNAVMAMLAAIFASSGMSVRTQMFAVPCFAITLVALMLYSRRGKGEARWLALLCVSVPLWANVHGSFVLAPVMVACFGLGEAIERSDWRARGHELAKWVVLGLGVVGLASLTPTGPRVFVYAVELAMKMGGGGQVSEWAPMALQGEGIVFYVAALVSVVCAIFWRRQIGWGAMLWMGVMWWLALTGRRNLIWWAMSAQLIFAVCISMWWRARRTPQVEPTTLPSKAENIINAALCVGLWSLALSCLPGGLGFAALTTTTQTRDLEPSAHLPYQGFEALNSEHPLRLLAEMREQAYAGEIFHTQAIGGLIEYALARDEPAAVAFVDQRFEMIPGDVWADYFAVVEAQAGWEQVLTRRRVGTLLLDRRESPKLVSALDSTQGWCVRGEELDHVWFERCER